MNATLKIKVGQHSEGGAKGVNEDSCGIYIPSDSLLMTKGVTAVIADGVSGSDAGREAARACVRGFLSDYYSTPDSWSVKKSAGKVVAALNHWLYGQAHKNYGSPRCMLSTLSVLVIKSATAYLFHVGDTRIYRLRENDLQCLTNDHRFLVSGDKRYLARAMGLDMELAIDCRSVPVEAGDLFLMTTDGVHDYLSRQEQLEFLLKEPDHPQQTVRQLIHRARLNGSPDNLTCQIVLVERLPLQDKHDLYEQLTQLPFPPVLEAGMILDGYRILRELHASKRVQVYLALDPEDHREVVLKTPSVNFEDDPEYIERFLHEQWVGKRLNSPHVLKIHEGDRRRSCLYYVTEHIVGLTLRQWIRDHPLPSLSLVRPMIEQIASGLYAFHRMEMFHQDLKPENVMIDIHGTVKIIDFGSAKIAGIEEIAVPWDRNAVLGTINYTAPECFQGLSGTERSDLFSLGAISYEMLTGRLPYGENSSPRSLDHACYTSAMRYNPELPVWVDGALRKAVQKDPSLRYEAISEFVHDLFQPNPAFIREEPLPLLEKNPTAFWRILVLLLLILNFILLYLLSG